MDDPMKINNEDGYGNLEAVSGDDDDDDNDAA